MALTSQPFPHSLSFAEYNILLCNISKPRETQPLSLPINIPSWLFNQDIHVLADVFGDTLSCVTLIIPSIDIWVISLEAK